MTITGQDLDHGDKRTNGGITIEETLEINKYRKALPQFLATTAKNLILLDLGMTLAFPALVIGSLLNSNEKFNLDNTSASWFGSISFVFQPIGSLLSGALLEYLGRKRSMLLVNVPHLLGWYLYYVSSSLPILFVAGILMGLGAGFMEAPVITYVGEISEPSLRGVLISYTTIFAISGLAFEFFLGTLYHWRTVAFISSFVPIITFFAISQIPETPMWLLSKGRVEDAEKSLRWLRGWVPATHVQKELNDLIRYNNSANLLPTPILVQQANSAPSNADINSEHVPLTLKQKLSDLIRPQIRKPLLLSISCFVFFNGCGYPGMRPYLVKILEDMRVPVEAHWVTVMMSCNSFLGVIVCTFIIRRVGKRVLMIASLTGCASCMLCLSLWLYLRENSADKSPSWTLLALLLTMSFSFSFGLETVPWMILSEVFPYRGRGLASAIAAASSYMLGFVTSKTFLFLKEFLGLTVLFSLYGTISVIGVIYVYFKLPETEGKSLEQIENFYKNKADKL